VRGERGKERALVRSNGTLHTVIWEIRVQLVASFAVNISFILSSDVGVKRSKYGGKSEIATRIHALVRLVLDSILDKMSHSVNH